MTRLVWGLVSISVAGLVHAEEYGRGSLGTAARSNEPGLGRVVLPPPTHPVGIPGGTWGLKLGAGWSQVDWSLGPLDGAAKSLAPTASLFYKTTDSLDVNFSCLFLDAEDETGDGTTKLQMTRLAVGVRYWPIGDSRITPYLGCGIGYYLLGGDMENIYCPCSGQTASGDLDVDDVPGAYLQGGVAWQLSDNLFLNTEIAYDLLLTSPSVSISGETADLTLGAFSIGLSLTVMLF